MLRTVCGSRKAVNRRPLAEYRTPQKPLQRPPRHPELIDAKPNVRAGVILTYLTLTTAQRAYGLLTTCYAQRKRIRPDILFIILPNHVRSGASSSSFARSV